MINYLKQSASTTVLQRVKYEIVNKVFDLLNFITTNIYLFTTCRLKNLKLVSSKILLFEKYFSFLYLLNFRNGI